jgi:hypothetical protein
VTAPKDPKDIHGLALQSLKRFDPRLESRLHGRYWLVLAYLSRAGDLDEGPRRPDPERE